MKYVNELIVGALWIAVSGASAQGEIKTVVGHNDQGQADASFRFATMPSPFKSDAASKAKFTLVDGRRDANGGELDKLHDGRMPSEEDQPSENFFFSAGTAGGRILVDLENTIDIKQVNSYSWHGGDRAPQVYSLYASDGKGDGFKAQAGKGMDPEKCGWKFIAKVDTNPKKAAPGGQYGVSISDSTGMIGQYRFLLFDISRTEDADAFGNTFYSEIDVIDRNAPPVIEVAAAPNADKEIVETDGGAYQITIDTSEMPELTSWAHKEVAPMVKDWYPKMVQFLPSDGFEAPKKFSIMFSKDMQGVASTSGTRIRCAGKWFTDNLKGEAKGAVFHEMIHVIQQYGGRRSNPNATRNPGWLVEGMTDYIRWYLFEPETRGAEITKRNISRAKYDASYRITANFLNWVVGKYDKDFIVALNAAMRQGQYSEELWKQHTGKTASELGVEWKESIEKKIANDEASAAAANKLSDAEKADGWQLLFNGENFTGWHNFKREGVRPGWQVKDASLVCVDPHNASDLVTSDQFNWFELQLDYNISEGGNSGIIYHVSDEGGAVWASGPEFQLEDNQKASDPVRCGWLYALYQPPIDPKTNKTLDATKPVGEWNHVRLLISPEKCEHEINGVKYFDYILDSDDFRNRVAASKFGKMPLFAKAHNGRIALQGDHGQVAFRNIKVRRIDAKQ
jgi:hypothetical protein